MSSPRTFIFAGGGTGGHLFPGIAVAEELRRREDAVRIVFVGSPRSLESVILGQHHHLHRPLAAEPLPTLKRNPFRFFWRNWSALRAAGHLLKEFRPTAVIGLGGYASAPVVWSASRHGIPLVLLEPNVIPGRTTRWLSRFADAICIAFEETRSKLPRANKVVVTGNPVRSEIEQINAMGCQELIAIRSAAKPELLVLGGSQGADSLNEAVLAAAAKLRDQLFGWDIVHQTGSRQLDFVRQKYAQLGLQATVEPFVDLPKRYLNASLAVSRAGATTLAELACAAVPMILLPFPHAMDDHQTANTRLFADRDAAVIVEHATPSASTADELAAVLLQLIDDPDRRNQMATAARQLAHIDAARQVANVIADVIGQEH